MVVRIFLNCRRPLGKALGDALPTMRRSRTLSYPAIEKTVERSTAGVSRRIVSTDKRRRQDIRERCMARVAAWEC